jgi:conjugative relaxase-like TrwC/TraI family protein
MQTTHKIPGSSAQTWAEYLIKRAARGDYYTRDGNGRESAPTQWHGPEQLLRSFGIDPSKPVELRHLRPLMEGFNPVTHEPIRPVGSNGTRTAGVDLTFSAPKDVSALWATVDPYRRAQIEAAHRKAVKSALEWTEREVTMVRRKLGRVQSFEKSKRLLAVEAVHTTSRLSRDQDRDGIPDPQLHSHVAVIAAERKDGKIAAVESKQLFRAAREGGAWYRAELAANLRDLGLSIERRQGKGERYFGIFGVSKVLSAHWSKRGEAVHRAANAFRQCYGREPGPGELDSITLATRGSKTTAEDTQVHGSWRAFGGEHNQTAKRGEELFNDWGLHTSAKVDFAKELLTEVTRERATVTKRELRAKAYELSPGVCRPAEAEKLIAELMRSGEILELQDGTYTTRRLRELEQATIVTAEARADADVAPVSQEALEQARLEKGRELNGSLSQEQLQALETITGPGGIAVIVGQAGTGKGVVLSAATNAWQKDGYEVIGTAIPGATAMRLQADTNSDEALTVDSLIAKLERGSIRLDPNTILLADEAGMFDSERLPKLVKLSSDAGAKLILAGDAAQLPSIGAGGLFKEIEGKVPTAELTEVHRAHHEWERKAWLEVREGEPGTALARYQAHDRLHIYDTRAEATQAMVESWDEKRKGLPADQTVMITDSSNEERDQMNAIAQERRAQAGELGDHRVQLPDKPYGLAQGDEVIFTDKFKMRRQKRVENGITGTVIGTSRDDEKVTILTREKPPREVNVDTEKFSEISLAYAVHIRKGQGMTAETSGLLAGGWQTDKEHIYVSLSRAREQTDVYITREDLGEKGMDVGAIERFGERMKRSRAQEASITKELADPTAERPAQITEPTADRPPDIGERMPDRTEPIADRTPSYVPNSDVPGFEPLPLQAAHPQEASHTNVPAERDSTTPQQQLQPAPPQSAIDRLKIDPSSDVDVFTQERDAIDWLEPIMKNQGASYDQFLAEVQKRYNGPEAKKLLAEAERQNDEKLQTQLDAKWIAEQREKLEREELETEQREAATKSRETGNGFDIERDALDPTDQHPLDPTIEISPDLPRDTAQPARDRSAEPIAQTADRSFESLEPETEPSAQTTESTAEQDRDRAIQEAIEANEQRQRDWQQGIEPDNDIDQGFGIE